MIDVPASICRQVNGVIVEIIYVFPCKRMMEGQETLTSPHVSLLPLWTDVLFICAL